MQPRFHRAQRDIKHGRDVVERGVGKESQFDDLPMFVGQRGDRLPNTSRILGSLRFSRRIGIRRRDRRCIFDGQFGELACDALSGFQEPMPEDAVKPRRESTPTIEAADRPLGFEQRFLGDVLGELPVAAESERAAKQRLGVLLDDLLKRPLLADLSPANQLAFQTCVAHVHVDDSPAAAKGFTEIRRFLTIVFLAIRGG